MTKEKLYARIDPLFNWIHGLLYGIRAWATVDLPTRFHHFECHYSEITQEQENALLDMVIGYVEGFDSFIGGGTAYGMLEDSTDKQADVLLKVIQAFVGGFGGTWESGEVYSVDSEGVRNG